MLVLVEDDKLKRTDRKMTQILELKPGKDKVLRTVKLKILDHKKKQVPMYKVLPRNVYKIVLTTRRQNRPTELYFRKNTIFTKYTFIISRKNTHKAQTQCLYEAAKENERTNSRRDWQTLKGLLRPDWDTRGKNLLVQQISWRMNPRQKCVQHLYSLNHRNWQRWANTYGGYCINQTQPPCVRISNIPPGYQCFHNLNKDHAIPPYPLWGKEMGIRPIKFKKIMTYTKIKRKKNKKYLEFNVCFGKIYFRSY